MSEDLYLEQKIDKILELLEEISDKLSINDEPIKIKEMAKFWGVSERSLYGNKRYLLPDFGKLPAGTNRRIYTKGEFMKWAAIGREELRRRYYEQLNKSVL